MTQPLLVYLANGVQGSAVVRAARRHGLKVRALVRETLSLQDDGIEIAGGDLNDASSLRAASEGVRAAVIQIPIGASETMRAQAQNAFAAARAGSIASVILKLVSASRSASCGEPSFAANQMIEDIARDSGVPFTIVRPTMYLDNLLKPSARADIVQHGVFAPPIAAAQRIAWTSVDDCAEAALTLLGNNALGGDHCIAGPESLTGGELAAELSAGFGRRIAYREQPLGEFERDVDAAMGNGVGARVASKFRYFTAHPAEANAILSVPYRACAALAGFQPERVADWARRHRGAFIANNEKAKP